MMPAKSRTQARQGRQGGAQPTGAQILRPDPHNANLGTAAGRAAVAESLRRLGAGRSVLVDRAGTLLAGNTTAAQAEALGLPVRVVDSDGSELIAVRRTDLDLSAGDAPEARKARELAIADNRTAELGLAWDAGAVSAFCGECPDVSYLWDGKALSALLADAGLDVPVTEAEDDVPAVPVVAESVVGEIYELGRHRLACGDSLDSDLLARLLCGQKVDCVFTSMPYAVGLAYRSYEDTLDNLRTLLKRSAFAWRDVIMPGGAVVTNFGDIVSGGDIVGTNVCEYPMAVEYWPAFRAAG